ncbi:glutamine amidotransferase [Alphaproteobacteria bacterium GH1-50]|uniref:Glutamine amidotransferase n=1 Tax=Kangsaoukella pontilimi TaxID=2691042 RepID=A0A7C9IEC8_9RHOB|nr:glutamine amidotransferase [Kangsaoukella pontilimi]MXQ06688.1 glutamine amidotransferase [Kangsaoukella pontilimi]
MKPFLVIQLRPEDEAADGEYEAFLKKGGLAPDRVRRIRLDQAPLPALALDDYAGVIVGGGPGCVSDDPAEKDPIEARVEADCLSIMPEITSRDMPFLGCCYGIGILAHHLGAEVSKARYGEPVGPVECRVTEEGARDPLLEGLPPVFDTLVGHKEAVQALPEGTVHLMASGPCPFQMIRHGQNVYATQFHPEADGQVFADRIRIYKNRGYFDPSEAEALTRRVMDSDVTQPERILRRFVTRYG